MKYIFLFIAAFGSGAFIRGLITGTDGLFQTFITIIFCFAVYAILTAIQEVGNMINKKE